MALKQLQYGAIALILTFAIATVLITRPQSASMVSGVSGLVTLKAMAAESVTYDAAMAASQPTIVEFYADWCAVCQAMSPTLQSLHEQWGDRVNFVMLNIDEAQWSKQVQQYQVTGIPHLALLDSEHVITDTFIGNTPKGVLQEKIVRLTQTL